MRENIVIVTLIIAAFALVGYINGGDIEDCQARGNSYEACERAFNR